MTVLGVAGELTAASIIVAAKGQLRFPEFQRDKGSWVDALTEYLRSGRSPAGRSRASAAPGMSTGLIRPP